MRAGVRRCLAEQIVFFDADLAYGLDAVQAATECLTAGADLVIGARDRAEHDSRRSYPLLRRASSK